MSTLITHSPEPHAPTPSFPADPPRKRWTRFECASPGFTCLREPERLELIEGDLITRIPKKRAHMIAFVCLLEWLTSVFGTLFLNPEGPIDVAPEDNPTSEPEPDFAVLARSAREYSESNPPAAEVRLLIEISNSTLAFDLSAKARLYARAGIADYWVVDVQSRRVIVHRAPANGTFQSVTVHTATESIRPLAAPESALKLASLFNQ